MNLTKLLPVPSYFLFTLILVSISFYSCDVTEGLVGGVIDVEEPPAPGDLETPAPTAVIIEGPSGGTTIFQEETSFRWTVNSEFLNDPIEYSFRLGNNSRWSTWSSETSVNWIQLFERDYEFQVRARDAESFETQDEPTSRRFTVNAVQGPSMMFNPRGVDVTGSSDFTVLLHLEEVESITGAKFMLQYDPSALQINDVEAFSDSLDNPNIDIASVVDGSSSDNGRYEINLAFAGTETGLTGSYPVARVQFTILGTTGSERFVEITSESLLRDENNNPVSINETIPLFVRF